MSGDDPVEDFSPRKTTLGDVTKVVQVAGSGPAQRFAAYARARGDRFIARVLPDRAANTESLAPLFKHVVASPHSVVTAHLIDEAGQPTIAARDEILAFFARRLAP